MNRNIPLTIIAVVAAIALAFWAGSRYARAPVAPTSTTVPATSPATTPANTSVAPGPGPTPPAAGADAKASAAPRLKLPLRLGVIGDSGSQSYSTRNWSMMEKLPLSWVDLMVETGVGDFGPRMPGKTGDAAASGYARAWSGYAYSTADIMGKKLELEAARALASGEVDAVIVAIGHDDFKTLLAARTLKKQVTPAEVDSMLSGFDSRYNAILDRLEAARRGTVIVHTLIDWYRLPFVGMMNLSPLEMNTFTEATNRANAIIEAAAARRRLPLVDLRGLFARLVASSPRVNGIYIETGSVGTEARFFFLSDGIHFGTAASAFLLNGLMENWGPILETPLPPLNEETILRLSGVRAPTMRKVLKVIPETPAPPEEQLAPPQEQAPAEAP